MNLVTFGVIFVAASIGTAQIPTTAAPTVLVSTQAEPVADGKFKPSWESLKQFPVPEWFRDAMFGIWAHWDPQCEPGRGDWHAMNMYNPNLF